MLANLDRAIRQLRRKPQGTKHAGRGTYRLLRAISESPGTSTRELAEEMDIRRASLNERLMRLENEGMIKRDRDLDDQRVYVVNLEPAGIEHLDRIQEIRSKMSDSIGTILSSEEIKELDYLAGKLAAGLEQIDTESVTNS